MQKVTKKKEKFFTRIIFRYTIEEAVVRTICVIYNKEDMNELVFIHKQIDDNSQFIEIGDELIIKGQKCKVVQLSFKVFEKTIKKKDGLGLDKLSPSVSTDFNCQLLVIVDKVSN